MLLTIPDALDASQLAEARRVVEAAPWIDGKITAGHQSVAAKHNLQIPEGPPPAATTANSATVPSGKVISQSPPAGFP